MKTIILFIAILILAWPWGAVYGVHYVSGTTGHILLQVEANGEAWYVYPEDDSRYYLGRPADAFNLMKRLALGAKHDFIVNTEIFPDRLSGLILLDVENNGEAYYIYPEDNKKYYLGRPADAFNLMKKLGRGITNADLNKIPINDAPENSPLPETKEKVLIENVTFVSQAPFGDWADPRQQDGCEEASALMAVRWARGQSLTKDEALKEITGLADWHFKKYGESRDTSASDTVDWIFKDYFGFDRVELKKDITAEDIIKELTKGNLIITPMNGQIMHNPNYKAPGPPRHMIVIRGYDPETEEFITNDPGTRKGELYRYDADILFGAIRDYPTGYHEVIEKIEKNMIVVSPEEKPQAEEQK